MAQTTAFAPHPRVVYRDLAEEEGGVLLHLDTGQYHGVNRFGSMIWHILDGGATVSTVVAALRSRLTDPPTALEDDVVAFLRDLKQRDLVVG